MIFRTYYNPKEFSGKCGFYDGGSKKVGQLLAGRLIA